MFGFLFLKMLNYEASAAKQKPKEIIESLELREGQVVADIGSGGGYFTIEFGRKVGAEGKVYAVDTRMKNLDFIRKQAERVKLDNIDTVLARGAEMDLPEGGLDLAFLRNAFHHLPEPEKSLEVMRCYLKPGGRVAVIEHKAKGGFSFVSMFKHYTPPEVIVQVMESAGYTPVQSFDFLPDQSFNMFSVK